MYCLLFFTLTVCAAGFGGSGDQQFVYLAEKDDKPAPTGEGEKTTAGPTLIFSARAENDLYRTYSAAAGLAVPRYETPEEAVRNAPRGAGVLILADRYPAEPTPLGAEVLMTAAAKKLRLYVEYPSFLPGRKVSPPRKTALERVVADTDAFGPGLKKMQILAVHDCHFVETDAADPLLVVAKVAGFDTAVFGLEDTKAYPILFEHPRNDVLVCTTKLSQFITARYAPQASMQAVWKFIFQWLAPGGKVPTLDWTPTVRPAYGCEEKLPSDAARQAILRAIDWHIKARLLLSEQGQEYLEELRAKEILTKKNLLAPLPPARLGVGDGRYGVLEGVASRISYEGAQPVRWWRRNDVNGETALAFALRWKLDGDRRSRAVAANLLDWVYFRSGLFQDDPAKANYGLTFWASDNQALYQDNDIKIILGGIGTSAALNSDRWDEVLVKNILGNFRTTGYLGFRGKRLNNSTLLKRGWRTYWRSDQVLYAPHYEAWTWASYLWLYDKTHYPLLLERTRNALKMMMDAYPDRWNWTNGIQQERGRMLLPLAWLVRVDDRPEHRAWLKRIADDMKRCQVACGAIREELGTLELGSYCPPTSNAGYGDGEAPLIQKNGDPVADLLYTCNFTFLGLHEAYAATGRQQYRRMADRLAEFLLRVQICCRSHPELDGGWFRAFDYRQWDYWGSNADRGWGAWCIEAGWTPGWITAVLALRELDLNLWDMSKHSRAGRHFEKIRREMIGDEPIIPFMISPGQFNKH